MYDHKVYSVSQRIVNLRQLYLRPIVRGKAKAPTEFGAKLDISVVDGLVRLEEQSFEAYNESELLQMEGEQYYSRYGRYPERVLADKIYRNRGNLAYCEEKGIRLSGPALGRPKKDAVRDRKTEYEDICDRKETTQTVITLSILALNLSKLQCAQILKLVINIVQAFGGRFQWNTSQKIAFAQ